MNLHVRVREPFVTADYQIQLDAVSDDVEDQVARAMRGVTTISVTVMQMYIVLDAREDGPWADRL